MSDSHRLSVVYYWYVLVQLSLQETSLNPKIQNRVDFNADEFYYNTSLLTWTEASDACKRIVNGSLLPITTETNHGYITRVKGTFHPESAWTGDYKRFDTTFVPQIGTSLNETTKCVALTITSITNDDDIFDVKYELRIHSGCSDNLSAMCICHSGFSNTLNVKTVTHGWIFYHNNYCGMSCKLWDPPYEHVTPDNFEMTVGRGNVTLRGLGSDLQVGRTYWVNVLATVTEKRRKDSGGIIECGYIVAFSDSIIFGPCYATRTSICQTKRNFTRKTTLYNVITKTTVIPINNETTNKTDGRAVLKAESSSPARLSTVAYVGIAGGSVVFTVVCISIIIAVCVSTKCCKYRDSSTDFKAKGGRSFVKQREEIEQSEENRRNTDDSRNTLYAQIDPNRIRRHSTTKTQELQQPDIVLTATTSGYLPMDGVKNTMSNNAYDVIKMDDMTSEDDGNYVEVDEPVGLYSVSSVVEEEESEYDLTFDRHPSQRNLITSDNIYDKANFVRSPSMENPVCNSVNMEAGYYSSLQPKVNVKNPNYDKIVIK